MQYSPVQVISWVCLFWLADYLDESEDLNDFEAASGSSAAAGPNEASRMVPLRRSFRDDRSLSDERLDELEKEWACQRRQASCEQESERNRALELARDAEQVCLMF